MATLEGEQPRLPSRSASFQRMLELEKRYKLERLQRSPPPPEFISSSPPPLSPVSPVRTPLQARRREALFQQQDTLPPKSPQRNIAAPPLSIDIPPARRARNPEKAPVQEFYYEQEDDNDTEEEAETPKMIVETHTKTVTFLEDDELTDQSSICQSPSWEGYGEKRKKKKEEAEQRKKEKEKAAKEAKAAKKRLATRLSKEPPPSEARPPIYARAASAPLVDSQHPLLREQSRATTIPLNKQYKDGNSGAASVSSPKSPTFIIHQTGIANGFIGGVRLEREREAAIRVSSDVNTLNSRSSTSTSHPAIDATQQKQGASSPTPETAASMLVAQGKKSREHTPPPVSYPPTSSKSFALKGKSHHSRSRSGSLLSEAAKLLNPRGHDFKSSKLPSNYSASNGSQETIQTVQSASQDDRGRSVIGNEYVNNVRSQSTERSMNGLMDELRLAHLAGLARTRSSSQQTRSTSPNRLPLSPLEPFGQSQSPVDSKSQSHPDSIERIRSPPAKQTPPAPETTTAPVETKLAAASNHPQAPPPAKKGFRAALKASINPIPPYLRRAQTAPTAAGGIGLKSEAVPKSDPGQELGPPTAPSKPERIIGEHNASEVTVRPTPPPPQPGSTGTTETRGSASSSSSYNDSSIPPSPVTTPDTSRPQSRRGVQEPALGEVVKEVTTRLVIEDDERTLRVPYEAVTVNDQSSSNYSSRANSRPGSREPSTSRNRPDSKENTAIDEPLIDFSDDEEDKLKADALHETWARTALPLDLDAQSFMDSFTNFDIPTPEVAASPPPPNAKGQVTQVEPIKEQDLDEENEEDQFDLEIPQRHPSLTKSFSDQDIADRIDTSFLPPLKHRALPPKSKARANHFGLSPVENELRPRPQARTISFDSSIPLSNPAAAYLQEARHAVSTSPRPTAVSAASQLPNAAPRPQAQPLRPALKSVTSSPVQSDTAGPKPIAKMFVECCGCKFYHDMPSRVYECMARPNEMVEDRKLGVSGAITTCVKCPWCSHNMSTTCCAGYAAVVYLREKLHGP